MSKKKVGPLPEPTKKLYKGFDLSFYHKGKSKKKPEAVNKTFSELFLNPKEGCIVTGRTNLEVDEIAKMMRDLGYEIFPTCDMAMNYGGIWNRRSTYLCDESGGGNPSDHKTWIWYKIDNTIPNKKIVRKIDPTKAKEHLTFSEADKIPPSRSFEFDGSFADLIQVLKSEGFKIIGE